jgi:hypothetical protein
MQIIFFTTCMISLILYLVLGLPPQEAQFKLDSEVIATHMTAWHKGSVRRCLANPCDPIVDPVPYLFPSMAQAEAFSKDRFTTNYDAATRVMMTSVNKSVFAATGISNDVIMAALNESVGGESSMIGVFDKASGKVKLTALTGIYDKKVVDVPPTIALGLTDGTPVIISNM